MLAHKVVSEYFKDEYKMSAEDFLKNFVTVYRDSNLCDKIHAVINEIKDKYNAADNVLVDNNDSVSSDKQSVSILNASKVGPQE